MSRCDNARFPSDNQRTNPARGGELDNSLAPGVLLPLVSGFDCLARPRVRAFNE